MVRADSKEIPIPAPNLYKCIVDKHSSFYYRIINKDIEIITLIDNRQNPEKVAEEIKSFFRKE